MAWYIHLGPHANPIYTHSMPCENQVGAIFVPTPYLALKSFIMWSKEPTKKANTLYHPFVYSHMLFPNPAMPKTQGSLTPTELYLPYQKLHGRHFWEKPEPVRWLRLSCLPFLPSASIWPRALTSCPPLALRLPGTWSGTPRRIRDRCQRRSCRHSLSSSGRPGSSGSVHYAPELVRRWGVWPCGSAWSRSRCDRYSIRTKPSLLPVNWEAIKSLERAQE